MLDLSVTALLFDSYLRSAQQSIRFDSHSRLTIFKFGWRRCLLHIKFHLKYKNTKIAIVWKQQKCKQNSSKAENRYMKLMRKIAKIKREKTIFA